MNLRDILKATGGRLIRGDIKTHLKGISTDSRTIKEGEVFLALKGKVFDGHNFIPEVIRKGARALVLEAGWVKAEGIEAFRLPIVVVDETLRALGDIAAFHRDLFHIPVVAITGSNGKTTTKEMVVSVLKRNRRTLSSKGTENNAIGVPLTLLKVNHLHQAIVLELGANHRGEISRLAEIARPSLGIITNVGPAHLEFLKDLPGVARAKCELLSAMDGRGVAPRSARDCKGPAPRSARDGERLAPLNRRDCKKTAILNGDDSLLLSCAASFKMEKITFGFREGNDIRGRDIKKEARGFSFVVEGMGEFTLNIVGRHNIYNALAAIALARYLEIDVADIRRGLADFSLPPLRMEEATIGDIRLIKDCYNANPQSMEMALETLEEINTQGRRIVVCGDMLELGEASRRYHYRIGKYIASLELDILITVGELSYEVAVAAQENGMNKEDIFSCSTISQAGEALERLIRPQDLLLIKGSRGMQMERILKCFTTSCIH